MDRFSKITCKAYGKEVHYKVIERGSNKMWVNQDQLRNNSKLINEFEKEQEKHSKFHTCAQKNFIRNIDMSNDDRVYSEATYFTQNK